MVAHAMASTNFGKEPSSSFTFTAALKHSDDIDRQMTSICPSLGCDEPILTEYAHALAYFLYQSMAIANGHRLDSRLHCRSLDFT